MKKLKPQIQRRALKIFTLLLCLLFITKDNLLGQSKNCTIGSYLVSTEKISMPNINLQNAGKFKRDFKKTGGFIDNIHKDGIKYLFITEKYELGKSLFLKMGKGKIKGDSILYFNISSKRKLKFYNIKKDCSLELLGYNDRKNEVDIYFKIVSRDCNIFFCFVTGKYGVIIEQFDY